MSGSDCESAGAGLTEIHYLQVKEEKNAFVQTAAASKKSGGFLLKVVKFACYAYLSKN